MQEKKIVRTQAWMWYVAAAVGCIWLPAGCLCITALLIWEALTQVEKNKAILFSSIATMLVFVSVTAYSMVDHAYNHTEWNGLYWEPLIVSLCLAAIYAALSIRAGQYNQCRVLVWGCGVTAVEELAEAMRLPQKRATALAKGLLAKNGMPGVSLSEDKTTLLIAEGALAQPVVTAFLGAAKNDPTLRKTLTFAYCTRTAGYYDVSAFSNWKM